MRVIFICLGNPFSPDMLYKENYFIKACQENKNDVLIIADNTRYDHGKIIEDIPGKTNIGNRTTLVRVSYDRVINSFITGKIRKCNKVYSMIIDFRPDVLFYNCIQIYNIKDIKKIKLEFPLVRIYGDVSTTKYNSGLNLLSKYILHRVIYKSWIKKVESCFTKIYYVVPESFEFLRNEYNLSSSNLEFNPLPTKIVSGEEKRAGRRKILDKYGLDNSDIIFTHAGKMDSKKKTLEIINIFLQNKKAEFKLLIAGSFADEIKEEAMKLIKSDTRIQYIGFLTGDDLTQLLCASDMYLQPGSPSQIAQTAMGCWCPVVLPDIETYKPFFNENGYLIHDIEELKLIFDSVNRDMLNYMSQRSKKVAETMLDYKILAKEIYQ